MGFLDFFGLNKKSQARQAIAIVQNGRPVEPARNTEKFADEGYRKCVIAYRCINLVSDAVSSVPLILYDKAGNEIDKHPLLDLLQRPNPLEGGQAFIKAAISHLLISGNMFVESVGANKNFVSEAFPPRELWVHRTERFRVIPGQSKLPAAYEFKVGHRTVRYPVGPLGDSAILHVKLFNPLNDYMGLSPIEAAAFDVDQYNSLGRWNLGLLKNQARPGLALMVKSTDANPDGALSEEQRKTIRTDLDENFKGETNSGKTLLLEGGIDVKELSFSPKDMDFIISKKTSSKDIALAFGTPGQLVGVEGSQTFSNYKQAREALYEDTAIPLLKFFLSDFNNGITKYFGDGLELGFDEDRISALQSKREAVWTRTKDSDFLTTNEKREAVGYGPVEESDDPGDQILVNAGKIPLGVAASDFEDFEDPTEDEVVDDDDNDDDSDDENGKEQKVFNIRNERSARRFWLAQNRKRVSHERRFTSQIRAVFSKESKELKNALDGVSPQLVEFVVNDVLNESAQTMTQVYANNISSVLKAFGEEVFETTNQQKSPRDKFDSFVLNFIENEVGEKITKLYGSTRKRVLKELREEIADSQLVEGESLPELEKRIEGLYDGFTKKRAAVIARTEVHNAATEASRKAAQSLNVPNLKKRWIAAKDERTRVSHRSMNGTTVDLDDKFEVPGKTGVTLMNGPGDINAPAEQIINCRCTLVYLSGG